MFMIVKVFGIGDESEIIYVWVVNVYFFIMMVFQVCFLFFYFVLVGGIGNMDDKRMMLICFFVLIQFFYGQVVNIFGWRIMIVLVVVFFVIGFVIFGVVSSMFMFVVGRVIMGVGGGGIFVMIEIIICDFCFQCDRFKYLGIVMSIFGLVMCVGLLIGGGLVEYVSWRWIFYFNFFVVVVFLVLLLFFLCVKYKRDVIGKMFVWVDWGGNIFFVVVVMFILVVFIWGGIEYVWLVWQIFVLLFFGIVGLGFFFWFELIIFIE